MLDDFLELILTILFAPFESKYENLKKKLIDKIDQIPNKALKILLEILVVIVIPGAFVIGLFCLISYIFRGYWI